MKITNEHVGKLLEARLERAQRAEGGSVKPSDGRPAVDRADFSRRSEDLRVGMDAARRSSRSDEARLSALTRSVRSGRYRVSSDVVADAILRDLGR